MSNTFTRDPQPRIRYAGDGVRTSFDVPFSILASDDLLAFIGDQPATGFAIAGFGEPTAKITFLEPPDAGTTITLLRRTEGIRETEFVDGGTLKLLTRREDVKDKKGRTFHFTEGLITTAKSFRHRYGYWEARVKLPVEAGPGLWPAFWLLGPGGWPPEIDVLEFRGGEPALQVHLHWSEQGEHRSSGCSVPVPDAAARFHDYGVLWTAEGLTWYLDRAPVAWISAKRGLDRPMYLIANLAIGGWAGSPGPDTFFPATYEIDRIAALVRTAIGFDQKRGDQVEVVNLRFAEAPTQSIPEPTGWMSYLQFTKDDIMRAVEQSRCASCAHLPRERWIGLLKRAGVIVGNSSAGLIECPALGMPCVNATGAEQRYGAAADSIKQDLDRLVAAYPETIAGHDSTFLTLKNGTRFRISDGRADKTFQELLESIRRDTIRVLSHVQVRREDPAEEEARLRREAEEMAKRMQFQHAAAPALEPDAPQPQGETAGATAATAVRTEPKIGRNEPCPCGSGKKYKHCHGQVQ